MFRNRLDLFARFAPDTPQGGTGDDSGSSDAPAAGFQRLLERHSDASELASKLFDENYRYRARIRQLEQQTQELQGKLPGEGALVLKVEFETLVVCNTIGLKLTHHSPVESL